jgi:hypothetical protein
MNTKTYIGIDNGVTGTIGIINGRFGTVFIKTPIIRQQDYTKKKKNIGRIDVLKLNQFLYDNIEDLDNCLCIIERPMINSTRFNASISAARALESTLTIIETIKLPYVFIDSKAWQNFLLPKGMKGPDLKKASLDIGIRRFPQFKDLIIKHGDADGILIAEYARLEM